MKILPLALLLTGVPLLASITFHVHGTQRLLEKKLADNVLEIEFSDPAPNAADVKIPQNWEVWIAYADHKEKVFAVRGAVPLTHRVVKLTLSNQIEPDFKRVEVSFSGGPPITLLPKELTDLENLAAAEGKDDANIYISGSIIPAVGSGPSYNIDSEADLLFTKSFGFSGKVVTDNRKKVDPDSFDWAFTWRHIPATQDGLYFDWGMAGMEFDRQGKAIDVISAPRFTKTVFFHNFRGAPPTDGSPGHLIGTFELDCRAGLEVGENVKNAYDAKAGSTSGSGSILRGVPEANAYLVLLNIPNVQRIEIASDYQVRIPARPELFLDTRLGTTDPVPFLRTQARHYVNNSIQFDFTKSLGLSVKHEYGSLPPAFVLTQHRVTIGLVLKLKQNRTLRF